jgi:hypothetical protein
VKCEAHALLYNYYSTTPPSVTLMDTRTHLSRDLRRMLTVLAIAHCGPSGVPSKCDLHEDTLRFLLNARVKTHGFTAVESLAIHSRRVEPALIPYVTTPSLRQRAKIFFFFLFFRS